MLCGYSDLSNVDLMVSNDIMVIIINIIYIYIYIYPKLFRKHTSHGNDSYPEYRRQSIFINDWEEVLDNRRVVTSTGVT